MDLHTKPKPPPPHFSFDLCQLSFKLLDLRSILLCAVVEGFVQLANFLYRRLNLECKTKEMGGSKMKEILMKNIGVKVLRTE